jgi:hypothetical protein
VGQKYDQIDRVSLEDVCWAVLGDNVWPSYSFLHKLICCQYCLKIYSCMNEHKAASDFKFEDPFFTGAVLSPRHRNKTCPHRKIKNNFFVVAKCSSKVY